MLFTTVWQLNQFRTAAVVTSQATAAVGRWSTWPVWNCVMHEARQVWLAGTEVTMCCCIGRDATVDYKGIFHDVLSASCSPARYYVFSWRRFSSPRVLALTFGWRWRGQCKELFDLLLVAKLEWNVLRRQQSWDTVIDRMVAPQTRSSAEIKGVEYGSGYAASHQFQIPF